ncbi:MAG: Biopolymer transport membrane proton channel, TolQ-related protein [Parcubacteria bacterium 34_609]|nr:MAG: Biopolymer transport membrane proton channel, TolQ-related protein [Parcubacteria bacterium 34_609]MDD3539009.1 MotA/TolQ/ExbB proton channel family protein [Atribacterota bacterium]MDD5497417.1 MotA/TolQ/ExbB proton channel family protein [Atribacterota bacterium]
MFELFQKGGFLMYPIFFCSLLAIAIFFERMFYLKSVKTSTRKFSNRISDLIRKGNINFAITACRKNYSPISQIILSALLKYGSSREEIKETIEDTANNEVTVLEKNLPILATVGNITPLLGLLGTVFGMIKGFQVISALGVGNPEALAAAISEALLTTAFGLSVAIPTIVAYNYLIHRVDRQIKEMELISVEILELLTAKREINEEDVKIDEILSPQ